MDLRTLNLRTLTLTAGLVVNSLHGTNAITTKTKEEISGVYAQEKEEDPELYKIHISNTGLHNVRNFIMPNGSKIVISRSLEDIKKSPLFMSGTKKNIGEFLGYKQTEYIIKEYNREEIGKKNINDFKRVEFPLIYDKLEKSVPKTLDALLNMDKLAMYKDSIEDKTMLVILPDENGKEILAYYVNNKLFVCTYVSIGLPGEETKTPKGLFTINGKAANRRSKKYDNAAMPYAMHIVDGVFMHQGTSDGSKRSHGCVRVPGLYEEFLFYYVQTGTRIIIL